MHLFSLNVWSRIIAGAGILASSIACAQPIIAEPVNACVIASDAKLTDALRAQIAACLGWQEDPEQLQCLGAYNTIPITPLALADGIHIEADTTSLYRNKPSALRGNVSVQQQDKIVSAQTAYIYRDPTTDKPTKIVLLGEVRYVEPDKLMIARKASVNPQDNSGETHDVLYRFAMDKRGALLPAWGRAGLIARFANKDYLLRKTSYTTCAPKDKAWDLQADSIYLDHANAKGVAKNARLRIHEVPVLYTPYFSFPTTNARKSGFLMPLVGYSNISGFDFGLPYYWNIAPNHDFTFFPHLYSKRGVMAGGEYRFLTPNSTGIITGNVLPHDRAYADFINHLEPLFPQLQHSSLDRWSLGVQDSTSFSSNVQMNVDFQQVSDNYYLQDFSANLALMTQRQLLRQATIRYTSTHWTVQGMGQSYQTLHPINDSFVSNVYERLPQIMARGFYYDLPLGWQLQIDTQYDQFHWPTDRWNKDNFQMPQGPRVHLNPIASLPLVRPWGFITPSVEFVENYYQVSAANTFPIHPRPLGITPPFFPFSIDDTHAHATSFNRVIPRYSAKGGLHFERDSTLFSRGYVQTLEPQLFYLNVPYVNQTAIPVYDSAYMLFNVDQLTRTNRFSGFDRIGDTNQLSYAVTMRWLAADTGAQLANFSIGQIAYFARRKVPLCQSDTAYCLDNPLTFGFLSPVSKTSPIASRAVYYFNPTWEIAGDYIWDPATQSTNNSDLNLHYQPQPNEIINLGYSYLANGDITQVRNNLTENNALHQATVAATWPLTDKWSTVGIYGHNISKNYSMMSLGGFQYDSCCWAMRVLGGRTFQSLNINYQPEYNSNIYFQILLKGLGTVATSDPANLLHTFIPGYVDLFHQ